MPPMAGPTPRSVFPTAMAAVVVPGTPLTEPAAVPRRISRKPTASACITVSRLTRMTQKQMTQAGRSRFVCFDTAFLPHAGSRERTNSILRGNVCTGNVDSRPQLRRLVVADTAPLDRARSPFTAVEHRLSYALYPIALIIIFVAILSP